MNLSGSLFCLNCAKQMQQGATEVGPYGLVQFRFCECGLKAILFTEVEGFEYSLHRERTKPNKQIQPTTE